MLADLSCPSVHPGSHAESAVPRFRSASPFTVARYQLADGRPPVQHTLPLAEAFRHALLACYHRLRQGRERGRSLAADDRPLSSPAFAGKDAAGRPLLGHAHAYFLPADEDGDGRLDHLTVVAEAGFDPDDVAALDRLRRLPFAAPSPVRLLLIALGGLANVHGGPLGESAVWSSATPFVATRYPKARGRKRDDWTCLSTPTDFAGHVLREELSRLRQRRPELPEVLGIEALSASASCERPPSTAFHRRRSKAGDDGDRRSHGLFRVFFATPIRGPLSLGYASHFGLGLYLPDTGVGESG